eukprot:2246529-Ditylum_brightwellii.AAC.1
MRKGTSARAVKERGGEGTGDNKRKPHQWKHTFRLCQWKYDDSRMHTKHVKTQNLSDTAHLSICDINQTYLFSRDSVLRVPIVGIGLIVQQAFFY